MVKEINEKEFNDMLKSGDNTIILVDYSAVWCGPCKIQHGILDKLEEQVDKTVKIITIDIDKNENMANQLKIRAVPTLQFFKNGKLVIFKTDEGDLDRLVGVRPLDLLLSVIDNLKSSEGTEEVESS
ncbi:MAG TPA: thioredoxin domain-containing protein [Candidatus Deferrimicrobium sp.]|nr:thioredoxin domain-containing protein [Candidatus Deferrimicrobium sp.]